MTSMVKGMKAYDVSMEHTTENFFATLKFTEDLGCWERNVQEEDLPASCCYQSWLAQVPRQQTEMVVMDPEVRAAVSID